MNRLNDFLVAEIEDSRNYHNKLVELFNERSQLYGSLIWLMKNTGKTTITIDYDELRDCSKLLLNFIPDHDSKILKLDLVENIERTENKDE